MSRMSKANIEQWNQAAGAFAKEQEQSAFSDMNKAVVKERFTSLSGEKVLDLGCGYGYYTDYLRSIGGDVIGVDGSPAMIEIAKEKYPESAFAVADITGKRPFEDEEFDIVFCNQVLMDIDPVGPVFTECRRVLKPGGIFYYSIVHPAFYTGEWKVDGETGRAGKMVTSYITPSVCENRFWGETKHYHRPLSDYLNGAAEAGLVLVHADEPKSYENAGKNEEIPLFFFAEYRKVRE